MQDALKRLNEYWTDRGCMVVQPFNTEVGAGTMNPATILRSLGPEPWRAAYVEPSVRPDDSRYGDNPNRLQTHTQFQVILKPDPGNPQELYLGSLEALGIDLSAHDVRFVEDNWAQPAIGAWGLGWEVWLDGMEITQFTYFQQVGGLNLDPVAVELTYGMERIVMAMQGVNHFKQIAYAPGISYGEAFGQSEYEMSRYYLDEADVEANRELYETYVAEAGRLIEARLPVPAHTYVLKSSHAFNVLDSRGAISTTERARAFSTMRNLTREVCKLWIARREELGFPLVKDDPAPMPPLVPTSTVVAAPDAPSTEPQTLAFEIGVEELPPHVTTATIEQVRTALTTALAGTKLSHGAITVDGTPRRIVAVVEAVAAREPDSERVSKGPRWTQAFDDAGEPTKALQGFLRGQDAALEDVAKAEFKGAEHASVVKTVVGRDATTVLGEILTGVVEGLRAEKNMRWGDPSLSFSRPIRWTVALLGQTVIPVDAGHVGSGRTTYVHRNDPDPFVELASADDLLPTLAARGLVVSSQQRREQIIEQANQLAASVGGVIDLDAEAGVIDEVTNLVEEPHGVLGGFEERYLELPDRILATVMRKAQRYLPVRNADGRLTNHFVTIANGPCDDALVAKGNEAVVRARFEDALFFWNTDLKVDKVDEFVPGLENLMFEDKLGSVGKRARRIADVAAALGDTLGLGSDEAATLKRAGEITKFDLATQLVVEMSSLAGFVAKEYAERTGETPEVALALAETELPRTASDEVPTTTVGALLAAADRVDLLVGMFSVGARPTGSSDQFGLRRAALGLVRILREVPALAGLSIGAVLAAAAERYRAEGVDVSEETVAAAQEFTIGRFGQLMRDEGVSAGQVQAVEPSADKPGAVAAILADLDAARGDERLPPLVTALVRIDRIVPAGTPATLDAERLTGPAEKKLVAEVERSREAASEGLAEFTAASEPLVGAINTFFDDVLVNDPDPDVKAARLGLLRSVRELAPSGLDFQAIESEL
ncbi:glycine--tRNA ligase [Nigerium massiliense]|uniref:glycine--tRNA ligase n=1 Tax=Nigerium massiliense TaxID=1522317 RepID=UPI000590FF68|nr:glycine--tRNA ligase [Nigerium massiliense]